MNSRLHPNHPYQYRNRRIDLVPKIDAKDALFAFLNELETRRQNGLIIPEGFNLRDYKIRTYEEAEWVKSTVNTPQSRFNSLFCLQVYHQAWQHWDYLPSNLGMGYVFFFVCGNCTRLLRHLYMPDGQFRYLCRQCYKLSYPIRRQKNPDWWRTDAVYTTPALTSEQKALRSPNHDSSGALRANPQQAADSLRADTRQTDSASLSASPAIPKDKLASPVGGGAGVIPPSRAIILYPKSLL